MGGMVKAGSESQTCPLLPHSSHALEKQSWEQSALLQRGRRLWKKLFSTLPPTCKEAADQAEAVLNRYEVRTWKTQT